MKARRLAAGHWVSAGQAGEVDFHLAPERRDEEVILVRLPHLAGVGEAEDVELLVGRPHAVGGHLGLVGVVMQ